MFEGSSIRIQFYCYYSFSCVEKIFSSPLAVRRWTLKQVVENELRTAAWLLMCRHVQRVGTLISKTPLHQAQLEAEMRF